MQSSWEAVRRLIHSRINRHALWHSPLRTSSSSASDKTESSWRMLSSPFEPLVDFLLHLTGAKGVLQLKCFPEKLASRKSYLRTIASHSAPPAASGIAPAWYPFFSSMYATISAYLLCGSEAGAAGGIVLYARS
jgi:hypothetical protein